MLYGWKAKPLRPTILSWSQTWSMTKKLWAGRIADQDRMDAHLASHWCDSVADSVGISPTGLMSYDREMSTPPTLSTGARQFRPTLDTHVWYVGTSLKTLTINALYKINLSLTVTKKGTEWVPSRHRLLFAVPNVTLTHWGPKYQYQCHTADLHYVLSYS